MSDNEIIEALATKVMGFEWEICSCSEKVISIRIDGRTKHWNPLKSTYDSKMLRERLAADGWYWVMRNYLGQFHFDVFKPENADVDKKFRFGVNAATEEMAVALCALKSVGIDPK